MKSNGKPTPRVLVIDDDLMVTRLLQEHLSNEGYDVSAVHMAEEGFDSAVKSPPDLIMLDVMLPDATGFQMCGRFRAHPATRSIPIIVMTGSARWPNQQYWGRRLGANEYILKPFNVIEVGERVRSFVGPGREASLPGSSNNGDDHGKSNGHASDNLSLDFLAQVLDAKLSRRETATEQTPEPVQNGNGSDPAADAAAPFLSQSTKVVSSELPEKENSPAAASPDTSDGQNVETLPDPVELLSQLEKLMVSEKAVEKSPNMEEPLRDTRGDPAPELEQSPAHPIPLSELTTVKEDVAALPVAREFVVPISDEFGERYVNFSAEIFIMVSRLASTRAEEYIADQLLRSGTSVGAKLHQALSASSKVQFIRALSEALQELRETGYWLSLTRKVGLLETLSKKDLETTCLELTSDLSSVLLQQNTPS